MARFTIFLLMIVAFACGRQQDHVNQKEARKAMKSQEIKRISDGELMGAAYQRGEQVMQALEHIMEHVQPAAEYIAPDSLIRMHIKKHQKSIDSLAKTMQGDIQWINQNEDSLQLKNVTYQVLLAYRFSADNELQMKPNVQRVNQDTLLYTQPQMLDNAKMKQWYTDEATIPNSVKDSFLGIWRIMLNQRAIVKNM